jgi:thiol-disulfide isomerase/thioredoxin
MNRCTLLGLALTLLSAVSAPADAQDLLQWQPSLPDAQALANEHGRLVLLHFWSESCPPCLRLEKSVFHRREFIRAVHANFVPVKVNVYQDRDLARRYEIKSIPTDVVLTADGRELFRSTSPQDVNRYVGMLDEVASHARLAMRPNVATDYSAESVPVHREPAAVGGTDADRLRGAALAPPRTEPSRYSSPPPATAPPGQVPPGQVPPGQVPPGQVPPGQVPPGQVPPGQVPPGQAPSRQVQDNPFLQPSYPERSTSNSMYAQQAGPAPRPNAPVYGYGPPASGAAEQNLDHRGPAPSSYNAPASGGAAGPPPTNFSAPAAPPESRFSNPPPAPPGPGGSAERYAMQDMRPPQITPGHAAAPGRSAPPPAFASGPALPPADMRQLANPAPIVNGERPMLPPGLDGYCPVTMVELDRWQPGDPRWQADFEQRSYWFAGPEQRQQFLRDPARYSPRLGGFDIVRFREQGVFVAGRREHGIELDQPHRFFLFADEASLQRFWSNPGFYEAALRGPNHGAGPGPR